MSDTTNAIRLRPAAARRVALAAQGFGADRDAVVTARQLQQVIDQVGQFQIDSINVLTRAHHMPLYSRRGPYDPAVLEKASSRAPRRLFEYWGHAASLIDIQLEPALRWRMARAREEAWGSMVRVADDHPGLVEQVLAEVAAHGPITARGIEYEEERRRDHWGWNWSAVKTACEWLLWSGQLTSAGRNPQFERRYALPDQVIGADILATPTPDRAEAIIALVARSARALGIASLGCLADYFRLPRADTAAAITHLADTGELIPATVDGWAQPLWLWHGARRPRAVAATALISPFDSLIFERNRLKALFGVDYKIEIYVPEAKRQYGYYSYCLLHEEAIVARVDLKGDRSTGTLLVQSAWREPAAPAAMDDQHIARALAGELATVAAWQGLDEITVRAKGTLAAALTPVV